MSPRPVLILETGVPLASLRRHGGFAHWIRVAAGLDRDAVRVCRVHAGEALPAAADFAAVIITGSVAMVTERHAWSERTADWLRHAAGRGQHMLGICYGHQLLAHAFGGRVDDNPSGREMGTVQIELRATAREDALFRGLPAVIAAHATHVQSVLEPPPAAEVLARSRQDGCQAFRIGAQVWGVQFHPEFSAAAMRGYVRGRAALLRGEGHDPAHLERAVRPTPQARRLLSRFVRLARQGH